MKQLLITLYTMMLRSTSSMLWLAFVLTRPFGATFGDLLTKPIENGGLNFGTIGSSIILFTILVILIVLAIVKLNSKQTIKFSTLKDR